MKHLPACMAAVLLLALLALPAHALSYTDDFTDRLSNHIKSYTNLAYFPMDGAAFASLPDRSAFSFASAASPTGTALYRAQNAQHVTVGLYTLSGSFVVWLPGPDTYLLGLHPNATGASATRQLARAGYSPSAKSVYTTVNNQPYVAYYENGGALPDDYVGFRAADSAPADLVDYGVNVYVSRNAQSWTRISLSQSKLVSASGSAFVYEELSGQVPSGTEYILVELNDYNYLQDSRGQALPKTATKYNCLASVTLSGDYLTLGEPEPVVAEPVEETAEPEEGTQGSSSTSSSKSSRSAAVRVESPAGSASKYAGSKFEGVIESPASRGESPSNDRVLSRASAPPPAATSIFQAHSPVSVAAEQEPAPLPTEPSLYQISAKKGDDKHFTAGITAYIIGVSGLLAYFVLFSPSKKQ